MLQIFENQPFQQVSSLNKGAHLQIWNKILLTVDHDEIWILYVKIITEPPETIKSRHFQVF